MHARNQEAEEAGDAREDARRHDASVEIDGSLLGAADAVREDAEARLEKIPRIAERGRPGRHP